MPFYQQSQDTKLTVDFGNGNTITLKLKSDDLDVLTMRTLSEQSSISELTLKRITRLEVDAAGAETTEAFDRLMDEVKKLRQRPDRFSLMVSFIYNACSGWVDYYADVDAERRNEPLPYNKENIEKMGLVAVGKICEALNAHFGFMRIETPEEKKEQLMISQEVSTSDATSPTIS